MGSGGGLSVAMRKSPCVARSRSPLVARLKSPSLVRRVCREFGPRAVTVAVPSSHRTARELLLQSARERMDVIPAYREAGNFPRAAAARLRQPALDTTLRPHQPDPLPRQPRL